MITSGQGDVYLDNDVSLDNTEVIDLRSGITFHMAPLAKSTLRATGGLLDGLPVVCGGYDDQIHSIAKNQSKCLGQLTVRRTCAASVVLSNNTLWVTGGYDHQSRNRLKSTECVTKEGKTSKGPDLPLALEDHAIVALNRGVFILIGGSSGAGSSSATYFYEEKKGWRPGPNLKNARRKHTARVLTDGVGTTQYVHCC